jgi:hypothetical protein
MEDRIHYRILKLNLWKQERRKSSLSSNIISKNHREVIKENYQNKTFQ